MNPSSLTQAGAALDRSTSCFHSRDRYHEITHLYGAKPRRRESNPVYPVRRVPGSIYRHASAFYVMAISGSVMARYV
jgi:hypothetical protein